MCHYCHLTSKERFIASALFRRGYSMSFIAKLFNRSKSTISREFRRNSNPRTHRYDPQAAQKKYEQRRKKCRHLKILFSNSTLSLKIKDKFLNHQWSPEQIVGRMKQEGVPCVSCRTIYRAIYAHLFDEPGTERKAARKLRHRGKRRHTKRYEEKRGKFKVIHPLAERPEIANQRRRIGDWEADTVMGKGGKFCLVTLVDLMSRYLLCGRSPARTTEEVGAVMLQYLKNQPIYTITADRGSEFAGYEALEKVMVGVTFYFPPPRHPQDRGTNENTNGLLREYFPKGTDLSKYTEEDIRKAINELNHRPRKCLGYRTPYEVYYQRMLHLI